MIKIPANSSAPPIWRKMLILALPVALQMVLQAFLGMADVIMVGGLGAEAVAAVGLAAKLHFLMLVTMMGVATACSIMVAQYTGANNTRASQKTLAIALLLGAVFMVPFTLIFCLGAFWLGWINPDQSVVQLTAQFLLITAPVLLLTQLITVYEAALRALGNTTAPLIFAAIAVVLNIGFNYVLIFGKFGLPELGVAGAAWGTLLARIIQLGLTLAWLYLTRHRFAIGWQELKQALEPVELQRFVRFSIPLLVNHAIWALGNAAYHVASGFAGTTALAVMGVMVPIETTFFALFVGFANAAAVMVGQALGRNDIAGADYLCRFFSRITITTVITLSFILWLISPWILQFFDHVDSATTTLLRQTIAVFCLGVWMKVINMLRILGVLRAGGDTHYCLLVDVIVMWVFGVPIYLGAVFFTDFSFVVLYALTYVEDALKWWPIRQRTSKGVWLKNLTG
ncbi:MATE family efflux transporter [Gilvimarinus sp. SDUM040013]|uniref:MATE family efflux transporter n=1 Tax=Gilvimarinus gilvus TaxID=3058038 RepID=A0ABU4S2K3_9GAMM|nr:MATE family efflux transporter [Gilvimarinus sp. SDUM040013]MDO3384949.1 MATE family efflux transporter [Gilvimarinus sp. SDUM040013]MDX6851255.1 MATE family efflux transporter [Gilvimarinus sp. SDUM040013]